MLIKCLSVFEKIIKYLKDTHFTYEECKSATMLVVLYAYQAP